MNCNTQNEKIEMLTDEWLLIGIDVGSEKHYARAFTNRKVELSRKAFGFSNDEEGFDAFEAWTTDIMRTNGRKYIICGMEPTGHYWINLANFIKEHGMVLAHINPAHVKKSKELDDTNPNKNDRKDPKTIAGLMTEGRYVFPYMPEGIYAEIRDLNNLRLQTTQSLARVKNRLARWFSIYFPEFPSLYTDINAVSAKIVLKQAPLPEDVIVLDVDGVNQLWREAKIRAVGKKKAVQIVEAAKRSIGRKESLRAARIEIKEILEDLEKYSSREDELMELIYEAVSKVPNADKLMAIQGIGIRTVAGFIAEVGDITRFEDAKSLQKLSGMAIVSNDSGKHNGQSSISYRGRKILRYTLVQGAVSVVAKNEDFAAIHEYYTTRPRNQLKKMQSIVAVACKLIRVFYTILTRGVSYDGQKMIKDIVRPSAA